VRPEATPGQPRRVCTARARGADRAERGRHRQHLSWSLFATEEPLRLAGACGPRRRAASPVW